jgi:hypothetical protein
LAPFREVKLDPATRTDLAKVWQPLNNVWANHHATDRANARLAPDGLGFLRRQDLRSLDLFRECPLTRESFNYPLTEQHEKIVEQERAHGNLKGAQQAPAFHHRVA